jgi:4-hydroxy-tetrahydrodipicolinate reductase
MKDPVRVAVQGAGGRMGRALIQAVQASGVCRLGGALDVAGSAALGEDAGALAGLAPLGVTVTATPDPADFDVLIDFTRPQGTLAALAGCVPAGRAMVIGTTGFTPEQLEQIRAAAAHIPICLSGNFSIGINLCLQLVTEAARALGEEFDIEVVEAHHRHKVDAPSGTALMLGRAAADGAGRDLQTSAVYARQGHTGERAAGTIGFSTVRGGDVVGDHSVLFLGEGERVEISHRASSRLNFARGAVRAAAWLAGRKPGLYSMQDVLAQR